MHSFPQETGRELGPVIEFEPVRVRAGGLWRVLAVARAALIVWGGISLAGAAAGGVLYAQGKLPMTRSFPEHNQPAALAAAAPVAGTPIPAKPRGSEAPAKPLAVAAPKVPTVQPVAPAAAASRPASRLPAQASTGPVPRDAAPAAPILEARLPQARPDEPLTTGSIGRREDAEPRRRFRRLRDVELRVPYAPGRAIHVPPLGEADAVGRHIRQVWTAFPRPFDPRYEHPR